MVRFEGSVQHKVRPSRWGPPARPVDRDVCPSDLPDDEVARVLEVDIEASIKKGWCSSLRDGDWPRYVWGVSKFKRDAVATGGLAQLQAIPWEARLTNQGNGTYKAWPARRDRHDASMPPEVEEALWP